MATIPRFFEDQPLHINLEIILSDNVAHHALRVLRLQENDKIILFNGQGGFFHARLLKTNPKNCTAIIEAFDNLNTQSPLPTHLGQVISRGDKMDLTIQKAVELGVHEITPLLSERCGVQLSVDRQAKRLTHWKQIINSAAEQSGCTQLPILHPITSLASWIEKNKGFGLVPDPTASLCLKQLKQPSGMLSLLIGPEGGLTKNEYDLATQKGFERVRLGPRILRTETAGLATLTAVQVLWGDF